MTLGQNICRLRTERGLSQGDLADALGVSRQSISKWETDASVPELEKLRRLSELFHISLDALVGGEAAPEPPKPRRRPSSSLPWTPSRPGNSERPASSCWASAWPCRGLPAGWPSPPWS